MYLPNLWNPLVDLGDWHLFVTVRSNRIEGKFLNPSKHYHWWVRMMHTQLAQNRKLRYTLYEKCVYCHKCYDGLSVIISKWHRDIGLTSSSVYMRFNALEHNFWSENSKSKTYLPFWPRKVKLCVVFPGFRCREFWSHRGELYHWNLWNLSFHIVCADCMTYKISLPWVMC